MKASLSDKVRHRLRYLLYPLLKIKAIKFLTHNRFGLDDFGSQILVQPKIGSEKN